MSDRPLQVSKLFQERNTRVKQQEPPPAARSASPPNVKFSTKRVKFASNDHATGTANVVIDAGVNYIKITCCHSQFFSFISFFVVFIFHQTACHPFYLDVYHTTYCLNTSTFCSIAPDITSSVGKTRLE